MSVIVKAYPFAQPVKLTAEFSDPKTCDAIDPDAVTLRVKSPSGVTEVYEYADLDITRLEEGSYYRDIETAEAGTWYYRWEGTGLYEAVAEHSFTIRETSFGTSP